MECKTFLLSNCFVINFCYQLLSSLWNVPLLFFHWKNTESDTVCLGLVVARFQAPWHSEGMWSSVDFISRTQKWQYLVPPCSQALY